MDSLIKIIYLEALDVMEGEFLDLVSRETLSSLVEVTPSTQSGFGHYQCNSAFKLAKLLNSSSIEIADKILDAWSRYEAKKQHKMIGRIEIGGSGFINIFLNPCWIATQLYPILKSDRAAVPSSTSPQRIVVEFSSPNIAKELHVGHLRSTIIGDALARLFEFLGHDVVRLNHIGDWGTQFGMLIVYMRESVPEIVENPSLEFPLSSLLEWYQSARKLFDQDPAFKKKAQLEVVQLQRGDRGSLSIWHTICDISRRAFDEIYSLLDVQLIERGESFYNRYLPGIVTDLKERGLVVESEGAQCIYLDGFLNREGKPLPIIIQKSDGGYNYDTTEMAALKHRIEEEHADRIIVVTDAGQSLHFKMLFQAAEKAGYIDRKKHRIDHVTFGLVLDAEGVKCKTRSGKTERLIDLLLEAVKRAKQILIDRLPEVSEEEIDRSAHVLGIDALKYADLSLHRIKDYSFSYDRMLRFDGNTAPFLLYAYVRIQSIKKRIGKNIEDLLDKSFITLSATAEVELGVHLLRFSETLDEIAEHLLPHRLAEYLYILAEKFHLFFRDCHVEGSVEENSRLLLCEAAARVLKKGMEILGLKTVDRM